MAQLPLGAHSGRLIAGGVNLDLGETAARASLGPGWQSPNETEGARSFVWATGTESRIELPDRVGATARLKMRVRPYNFQTLPEQFIEVDLGGPSTRVGPLDPGWDEVRLSVVDAGGPLRLTHPWARSPATVEGNEDHRQLAVAYDHISISWPAQAPTDAEEGWLTLPAGSRAAWRVQMDGETRLVWTASRGDLAWALDGQSLAPAEMAIGLGTPGTAEIAVHSRGGGAVQGLALKGAVQAVLAPRPNIVLVVVDSLRGDRFGENGTMSRLAHWAQDAIVFQTGRAHAPWTRPSVATIFTGLWPWQHGAVTGGKGLSPGLDTLAERLALAGYDTKGLVNNSAVDPQVGFDQGFVSYRLLAERSDPQVYVPSEEVHALAEAWLDHAEEPFFLYLHTADPHYPYAEAQAAPGSVGTIEYMASLREGDPSAGLQDRDTLVSQYEREVQATDASVADFFGSLEGRGLNKSTVVVFTADHGEEFADHGGWEHGSTLYAEMLDVPLAIRGPGLARDTRQLGRHVDLMPTLLALADVAPAGTEGVDLLAKQPNVNLAQSVLRGRAQNSVESQGWKLIVDDAGGRELYALHDDPQEQHNLAGDGCAPCEELGQMLGPPADVAEAIDVGEQQALRELGYID